MQSRRTKALKNRRGFTLIELLVVISIIATLMSLILPAIQNAREAGRRTQCLNNIRNVTLATLNFASANKSRLPALAYFPDEAEFVAAGGTASGSGRIMGRSWAVELLPYIDQQGTYDRWNKAIPFNQGTNAALPNIYIEAFACPNDDSAFQQIGGLSYVANAGYGTADDDANVTNNGGAVQHSPVAEPFDWNGNGTVNVFGSTSDDDDRRITQATGVFWAEFAGVSSTRNASASVGKIYDGSGNTLMFGENVNAGGENWADPRTRACGFIFPLDATSVDQTSMADVAGVIGPDTLSTPNPAPAFPNEAKTGPEGVRPYLNSNHPGIVVVSYCDGGAKTMSENIDQGVYVRLMTPDGTRLRTTSSSENPVSADEF